MTVCPFEFHKDGQEDPLMVSISRKEQRREFIQVPCAANLVMADFNFSADDLNHLTLT